MRNKRKIRLGLSSPCMNKGYRMNRIGRRLLFLTLLIFIVCLVSSCGNQPGGVNNSSTSSEGSEQPDPIVQQEDPLVREPAKENAAETETDIAVEGSPATEEAPSKQVPAKAAVATNAPKEAPAFPATKEASVEEAPEPLSTVSISIIGDEQKGIILESISVDWQDGDSVLDVLKQVTKSNRIPLEYRGSGILSYVEGIANLYEFDQGAGSGWLFKVNGQFADKSAGAVKLSKGDVVEWIYSIELIEDPDN